MRKKEHRTRREEREQSETAAHQEELSPQKESPDPELESVTARTINSLAACSLPTIQTFLEEKQLPVSELKIECLGTVRLALTQKLISLDDVRNFIAVSELESFSVEAIQGYLRQKQMPVVGLKQDLLKRVRVALSKRIFPISDMVQYVDSLRENGGHHIFLFRLQEQHRDYLERLRNPNYVREQLARHNLEDLYDHSRFILEADAPQLAAVTHDPRPEGTLVLKWVETRSSEERLPAGTNPLGQPLFVAQGREERSVNFFRVDLATGNAEIRIQELPANSTKTLRDELKLYRAQAGRFIDLSFFSPVLLEPVARKLLTARMLRIQEWGIVEAGDKPLGGKRDPSFWQTMRLLMGSFSAVHLSGDWCMVDGAKARIVLNGRTDELFVPRACTADQLKYLATEIRRLSTDEFRNRQLKHIASEHTEWLAASKKMDLRISELEQQTLDDRRIEEEEWIPENVLTNLFQKASTKYPKSFEVRFYVRCPDNGQPASVRGAPLFYDDPTQVPPVIQCENVARRPATHPTQGNLRARLKFKGGIREGLLAVVRKRIHKSFSPTTANRVARAIGLLLFTVPLGFVLWASVWLFGNLTAKYPQFRLIATVAYMPILLLATAALVALLDPRLLRRALTLLRNLAILAKGSLR